MAWKKFTAEEAKENRKAKLDNALAMLEQGIREVVTSGRMMEYISMIGKFHRYSLRNQILIMVQHPTAKYVAGYNAWQDKFDRHVKKNERGIDILAPITCKTTKTVMDDDGNEVEEEVIYRRYKTVCVFADDQTDGKDLPEICRPLDGTMEDAQDILQKLEKATTASVVYGVDTTIEGGAHGYFAPSSNTIMVDDRLSDLMKIKTLTHEIAHSILHCKGGDQEDAVTATKEIQAESVAYAVLSYLGADVSEYSTEYVASWGNLDTKTLVRNFSVISETASTIIDALVA